MPENLVRSKRAVAVAVAVAVASVSIAVLSGHQSVARAAAAPSETVRASVTDAGAQSQEGGREQELSADGTAVVFTSYSPLDALAHQSFSNVYVRDLRRNHTVLISRGQLVRTGGDDHGDYDSAPGPVIIGFREVPANDNSSQPTISADGRYVAFVTGADNILPEDDDRDYDLLVCDRDPDDDGVFDELREGGELDYEYFRVNEPDQHSTPYGGYYRTDNPSEPKLADDASRIVWKDVSRLCEQVVRTAVLRAPGGVVLEPVNTEIVATPLPDVGAPLEQRAPDVSGDGRYVVLAAVYERRSDSDDSDLVTRFAAVVRKDTATGAVLRVDWDVSTVPDHVEYLSADRPTGLTMSADGREIAFVVQQNDPCTGSPGSDSCPHRELPVVFVVRIGPDGSPVDSVVASRDNDGEIVNGFAPALSGDGRFLAFGTDNFAVHDGVDLPDRLGCLDQGEEGFAGRPMLSLSGAPDRDRRTVCQIVVRDLVTDRDRLRDGETRLPGALVSAGLSRECAADGATCPGDDNSPPYSYATPPSLSHNGSTIAFESAARDLVPGDDNRADDVFVRTFRPGLTAAPSPLAFGEVKVGDTADRTVRFDHVGIGPLVVTVIAVTGKDFGTGAQTCGGEAVVLQQAGSCEVAVRFTPTAAGAATGTLTARLRDGREVTVPLQGTGTTEPVVPPDSPPGTPPAGARFAAGPDPLAFGDRLLLSDGPARTVTVTNTGGSPLRITAITVVSTVAPHDYAVAENTCTSAPVAPAATCRVTVRFSPTAPEGRPAVLRFADNTVDRAHLITLTGNGSTPAIVVSPAVTQPGRVITVTGTGFAPNRAVTVTIGGSAQRIPVTTGATGGFRRELLVLPKSAIGNRAVVATVDTFPTIRAQAPVLIVTPPVSPADFVVRG